MVTNAPPDALNLIDEVKKKEAESIPRADWFDCYAYISKEDSYFDIQTRDEVSRSSFNALFRHVNCTSLHGGKMQINASNWFDENRVAAGSPKLQSLTYAPGESALCTREGLIYGNRWKDARVTPKQGNVSLWLDHINELLPNLQEQTHLLNVMAYKMQHPNKKINHAVLLGGNPGTGKDTLLAPFIKAVCGTRNLFQVTGRSFESNFTYFNECEVLVLNELKSDQSRDRRAFENTLKPIIAIPPEYLTVNRKGSHPYEVINRILVIAMSNFRDAIALPADDRRWYCLWTYADPMTAEKATRLWKWYSKGGIEAIAYYLMSRDVSAFNPSATPPMTQAKATMLEASLSTAEAYIYGLVNSKQGPFANGVIGSPMRRVIESMSASSPPNIVLTLEALHIALKQAGWIERGMVKSRAFNVAKNCFCAPQLKDRSASYLRNMMEAPLPNLTVVT